MVLNGPNLNICGTLGPCISLPVHELCTSTHGHIIEGQLEIEWELSHPLHVKSCRQIFCWAVGFSCHVMLLVAILGTVLGGSKDPKRECVDAANIDGRLAAGALHCFHSQRPSCFVHGRCVTSQALGPTIQQICPNNPGAHVVNLQCRTETQKNSTNLYITTVDNMLSRSTYYDLLGNDFGGGSG